MNSRIEILDSLRAFAALSVCLFHFVCTTTGYVTDETARNVFGFGKYGVQMFFVISGFVIPWSMHHGSYRLKNFGTFFLKRLSRLEPPYILSVLIALAVYFLRERLLGRSNEHMEVSGIQVALHAGYLIPFFDDYQWLNQVYWTLAVEFQYYLLMALLFVPMVSAGLYARVLIYVALTAAAFLTDSAFLPHWLPLFLLGIVLFLFKSAKIGEREFYIVTGGLLIFCCFQYALPMVTFALLPVMFVLLYPQGRIRTLHGMGGFSYSIYLIHPIIGGSLVNVLSHKFTLWYQKPVVILAGVAVTLVASWITYLIVEKPSKRLSASIRYAPPEVTPVPGTVETNDFRG